MIHTGNTLIFHEGIVPDSDLIARLEAQYFLPGELVRTDAVTRFFGESEHDADERITRFGGQNLGTLHFPINSLIKSSQML